MRNGRSTVGADINMSNKVGIINILYLTFQLFGTITFLVLLFRFVHSDYFPDILSKPPILSLIVRAVF